VSVLELLRNWLPLLVVLNNVGAAAIIWAVRRASKDDVARVEQRSKLAVARVDKRCQDIEVRLSNLEELGKLLPTREDLHLLRLQMMKSSGRIRHFSLELKSDRQRFTAEIQGARAEFDRQIKSTETLVERTERTARMVTEHLLNKER
jgi:hypothetical protein